MAMRRMAIGRAFTLIEPGPVVLVTTNDGRSHNIMTISWTMVMDFTPSATAVSSSMDAGWIVGR